MEKDLRELMLTKGRMYEPMKKLM